MSYLIAEALRHRRQSRRKSAVLGLGLLALAACRDPGGDSVPGSADDSLSIEVNVTGLSLDSASLTVSAMTGDRAACPLAETTVHSDLSHVTLRLPKTTTGLVQVQAAVLDSQGDAIGWAENVVALSGSGTATTLVLQTPIDQGIFTSIWGSDSVGCPSRPDLKSTVYLGGKTLGRSEAVLVLKQHGMGWSKFGLFGGSDPIFGLWGSSTSDLWAVAPEIFHYDGTGWDQTRYPGQLQVSYAVWGSGPSDVWAVGDGVLHWDGKAWNGVIATSAEQRLYGLWASGANDIWAVGESSAASTVGVIKHWDGTAWTTAPTPGALTLYAAWGSGPRDVWAVGSSIMHWDGTAWKSVSFPGGTAASLSAVWGSGPRDIWAVGTERSGAVDQGIMLHWDGTAWTDARPPKSASLLAVWGSTATDVWVTGTRGTYKPLLLHWDGKSWSVKPFLASL